MALIDKTSIGTGNTIQAEHITRIIDALNESGSYEIIATGSFTGSFTGDSNGLNISGSLATTGSVGFSYFDSAGGLKVWSAGGALSQARYCLAGAGTQNAGLAFGGQYGGGQTCTEEYNGSSWSAGGALSTARYSLAGAGTQNAALAFAGSTPGATCTEEYDGSSWSAGGALICGRARIAGAGTQDAGLAAGGAPANSPITEEYNGTSWSAGGNLITTRNLLAGAGTQNAGLVFGGYGASLSSATEEYDGSSWSAGGALSTARYGLAGAGTQNAGLAISGKCPTTLSCTEEYDGSSWSAGGSVICARNYSAGAGTQNAGLAFGGCRSSYLACTEEYNPLGGFSKTFDYSSTTGTTTVSCLIETSAERYKDNIQPMGSQLNKVMQLQPVEFDWKSNKKHDIGFVADSVKNVYPNLVSEKDGQVEGMNYSKLVSALVKSIQEQQEQINELKARLDNNN